MEYHVIEQVHLIIHFLALFIGYCTLCCCTYVHILHTTEFGICVNSLCSYLNSLRKVKSIASVIVLTNSGRVH